MTWERLVDDLWTEDGSGGQAVVQICRCPNARCLRLAFVVQLVNGADTVVAYPTEDPVVDVDGIPGPIADAYSESMKCSSIGCHAAAAIMIRKTLELLCDHRGARGDNLKAKLESLRSAVVLPSALMDALDDLRLLGNDAAHVESKIYDTVGKDEVGIAQELAREILRSVYQLADLVSSLRRLRRNDATPTTADADDGAAPA